MENKLKQLFFTKITSNTKDLVNYGRYDFTFIYLFR